MTIKRAINWDLIEKEYRGGIRSLREIASEFDVSHVYIQKKAKEFGWVKNLDGKIRAKAQELINKSNVNSVVNKKTESQIIDCIASQQTAVLLNERADIVRLSNLCEQFEMELEIYSEDLEKKARVIKTLTDTRKNIIELRRRNFNITDNSNCDADTQQDSFAAWVKSGNGKVIGVIADAMVSRLPANP